MDEIDKARVAKPGGDTIFGKIIRGEIPTTFLHEDDQVFSEKFIADMIPLKQNFVSSSFVHNRFAPSVFGPKF